jgi:hypothetical protein
MPTTEHCYYRGYEISPQRQWSSWCVGIYPTRSGLPLLPRSPLHTLTSRKQDALAEAKQAIDRVLSRQDK